MGALNNHSRWSPRNAPRCHEHPPCCSVRRRVVLQHLQHCPWCSTVGPGRGTIQFWADPKAGESLTLTSDDKWWQVMTSDDKCKKENTRALDLDIQSISNQMLHVISAPLHLEALNKLCLPCGHGAHWRGFRHGNPGGRQCVNSLVLSSNKPEKRVSNN